ncbi:MAG: hypothetical protein FJ110_10925 [Deltaproteobacteria bacterium]|nr:hypothetical protein [Deltaproteobacteria bacterium]
MQFSKEPTVIRSVSTHNEIKRAIGWNESHYLVGNDANKRSRYCTGIYNVDDLLNYYELFLRWYERKYEVKFDAITLPYSVYDSDGIAEKLAKKLSVETVVGQGVSALEYLIKTNNAENKTTLLIDGGFNSVNVEIIKGDEVVYYETYYNQVGVRDLIEKYFRPLVRNRIPDVSHNSIRLDEVLKNGYVDYNFERIYFEDEKKQAIDRYIREVFRQIKSGISNELMDFDQAIIVGGLAYFVSPDMIETSKTLVIPAEYPEYLNVLGASMHAGFKPALDLGFGYTKYIT